MPVLDWIFRRTALAHDPDRWVVLDVESSGLDVRQDRLLSIAAIALRVQGPRPVIELGDSFEIVLQQDLPPGLPDRDNILLHGIGIGAQSAGVERRMGLQAFMAWSADSPLLAFHAAFDRSMIERALRIEGLTPPRNPWLDLEPLASVLRPDVKGRTLDAWMQALGIECAVRHQAAADTLATAELLLKLWPALRAELPKPDFRGIVSLARQRRWLPG